MEQFGYYDTIFDIYRKYGIRSFPIDVFSLLIRMGYDVRRYSNLPPEKLDLIMQISPSACLLSRTVFYNDREPLFRIRFSICHELAHDILEIESEDLADMFASEFLAPSPIIRTRGIRTADELSEMFELSISASNRAIFRAKKWTGYRLPKEDPAWQIIRWFDGDAKAEEPIVPEVTAPKRLPPLISAEEKEKWTPEQQKRIASIRRKRRKISKQMDGVEGTANPIVEFGLFEEEMEYLRLGEK